MSAKSLDAKLARLSELEHRFSEALDRAKLDAMKELAYGAGHEINNPLANIASRAQTLLQGETDPEKRRKLAAINAQAFRAHEMIADLMLFARPPQLRPERVDVISLLSRVVSELRVEAEAAGVSIVLHNINEPINLIADPTQLAVAIRALCTNAMQAIPHGGTIDLSARQTGENRQRESREGEAPAEPSSHREVEAPAEPSSNREGDPPRRTAKPRPVKITISDNGPGIPRDIRPKIFDPFFSGREAGRGLGFGLSKAWRIVTLHGGAIDLHKTPGGGATFIVKLPFSPPAQSAAER
jgi:signal transduction histidine kinase